MLFSTKEKSLKKFPTEQKKKAANEIAKINIHHLVIYT